MNIEIAEPGRMTQTGSSLLKLIQNNNMPILDLLVRESIQNSLDASNKNDKFVNVEFLTGKFISRELSVELDGISKALERKFSEEKYDFIAIKDSNTVGLTGKLHYEDVKDNNYGNLLKLIYEISKPQQEAGAGGSWGLGKTVYFRVGIGLVIYYSRIKNEYGEYESRLAASLVENELKSDSLIPKLDGKSKRGIAWWGQKLDENKTQPIRDEAYINKILNIFSIKPYYNTCTGTTVIIPYIDKKMLLSNNQVEDHDGEEKKVKSFWHNNINEYLKIAVQRWYAPRLNNIYYPYGCYLRVKINNIGLSLDDMEPIFKVIQALYNRAVTKKNDIDDILSDNKENNKNEEILIRKVLESTKAGIISYTKVQKDILMMNFPNNKPSPYMYCNCGVIDCEKNKPILTYVRKPGMIVSYENYGPWVDGINSTNKEEFIIAIFVLNSNNRLSGIDENDSLEDYVRKSELADHTSWQDFSFRANNPRIISKIQNHVKNKISKEFSEVDEEISDKLNSGLGKMFGDLLLPPENFGNRASVGTKKHVNSSRHIEKHKDIEFSIDRNNIKYASSSMEVIMQIKTRKRTQKSGITIAIDSENGVIPISKWEGMGMDIPFYIEEVHLYFSNLNEIEFDENKEVIINKEKRQAYCEDIECILLVSEKEKCYGIEICSKQKHSYIVNIRVKICLERRNIKPVFEVIKSEGISNGC